MSVMNFIVLLILFSLGVSAQNCDPLVFSSLERIEETRAVTSKRITGRDPNPQAGLHQSKESLIVDEIGGNNFFFRVQDMVVGRKYRLVFFQAFNSIDESLDQPSVTPTFWNVNLDNSLFERSNLILKSSTKLWQKVQMVFTARSRQGNLEFTASKLFLSSNASDRQPEQINIRGIILSENNGACISEGCEDYSSFNPTTGKRYVLSAWVKKDTSSNDLGITLAGGGSLLKIARPNGAVIDGWQKIETTFSIEDHFEDLNISMFNNTGNNNVYFDDIRIHPFDGNMKSFVYDPVSQKLVAELDENNYATFYEYDNEGGLIRVKKETVRGIQTIQETRSNTRTIENTSN